MESVKIRPLTDGVGRPISGWSATPMPGRRARLVPGRVALSVLFWFVPVTSANVDLLAAGSGQSLGEAQTPSATVGRPAQAASEYPTPDKPETQNSDKNEQSEKEEWIRVAYTLGPDDQLTIRALDSEELNEKAFRIDLGGFIRLPMIGRLHVAGMTVEQLESELTQRLKVFLVHPDVSISVTEFRSQPVSVFGAVRNAGVHQVQGRKTLVEMLSAAGGLEEAAGSTVKITRRLEWGRIPLKTAMDDPTGQFSVAEVKLNSILHANNPEENILVRPYDVITVPRAEMVYVVGEVQRAGGFVLRERENMTVLQALSMAGGLDRTAAPQNARILRSSGDGPARSEVAVNLKKILTGKTPDIPLSRDDILFIPSSTSKKAAVRAAEAAIQVGTGLLIWRR